MRNFGLIIGDLVPLDNKVWELYIALREIICILLARSITPATPDLLAILIARHHTLYKEIFSEHLKPKFHFLIHYPLLLRRYGPIRNLSCIRYEAKHKDLKSIAKAVTSRQNPAYTLALRNQIRLSCRFISREGLSNRVSWGLEEKLSSLSEYESFMHVLPSTVSEIEICVSWVNVNGTVHRRETVIALDTHCIDRSMGKIKQIIINKSSVVSFVYQKMQTVCFSRHVHAFEVMETNEWGFISFSDLIDYTPYNLHSMANGKLYVPCV